MSSFHCRLSMHTLPFTPISDTVIKCIDIVVMSLLYYRSLINILPAALYACVYVMFACTNIAQADDVPHNII